MLIIALTAALILEASPSVDAISKPTPRKAAAESQSSSLLSVAVTVECTARADGHVENCRVLGETHPGQGFGQAAVALMDDATVEPGARDFQFARTIQFTP